MITLFPMQLPAGVWNWGVIRCMDEDGKVITYAGGKEGCALGSLKEVQFSAPTGLCWADGVL